LAPPFPYHPTLFYRCPLGMTHFVVTQWNQGGLHKESHCLPHEDSSGTSQSRIKYGTGSQNDRELLPNIFDDAIEFGGKTCSIQNSLHSHPPCVYDVGYSGNLLPADVPWTAK